MNLKPMEDQRKPAFRCICSGCNIPIDTGAAMADGKEVYADLDGKPFAAYYCHTCKDKIDKGEGLGLFGLNFIKQP